MWSFCCCVRIYCIINFGETLWVRVCVHVLSSCAFGLSMTLDKLARCIYTSVAPPSLCASERAYLNLLFDSIHPYRFAINYRNHKHTNGLEKEKTRAHWGKKPAKGRDEHENMVGIITIKWEKCHDTWNLTLLRVRGANAFAFNACLVD